MARDNRLFVVSIAVRRAASTYAGWQSRGHGNRSVAARVTRSAFRCLGKQTDRYGVLD